MKPHPLTLAYVEAVRLRPGMYYANHNIRDLENQLHGFDAALSAASIGSGHSMFNPSFNEFVHQKTGLSGSQGWARALLLEYGQTARAEEEFWRLFAEFASAIAFRSK